MTGTNFSGISGRGVPQIYNQSPESIESGIFTTGSNADEDRSYLTSTSAPLIGRLSLTPDRVSDTSFPLGAPAMPDSSCDLVQRTFGSTISIERGAEYLEMLYEKGDIYSWRLPSQIVSEAMAQLSSRDNGTHGWSTVIWGSIHNEALDKARAVQFFNQISMNIVDPDSRCNRWMLADSMGINADYILVPAGSSNPSDVIAVGLFDARLEDAVQRLEQVLRLPFHPNSDYRPPRGIAFAHHSHQACYARMDPETLELECCVMDIHSPSGALNFVRTLAGLASIEG